MTSLMRLVAKVLLTAAFTVLSSIAIPIHQSVGASSIGSLDSGFGNSGVSTFNLRTSIERALKVLVDAQGRILVLGKSDDRIIMTRFLSTGALDTSLEGGTKLLRNFSGPSNVLDAAFTADNKIVVAWANSVFKMDLDGVPDTTFGIRGTRRLESTGVSESLSSLTIQSDGKIIAVGSSSGSWRGSSILAIRLNADGTFDNTFGNIGVMPVSGRVWLDITNGTDFGHKVIAQSDSKVLISGVTQGNSLSAVRLNINGAIDTTFATNGVYTKPHGVADAVSDLHINADGRILISGVCADSNQINRLCITRLNANGSADNSFGTAGTTTLAVVMQPQGKTQATQTADGKILFTGTNVDNLVDDFSVTRLTANGNVDTSFGNNGIVRTAIVLHKHLAIDDQQRIVLAGISGMGTDAFSVTRLTANGNVDTSFGNNGLSRHLFERGEDFVADATQLSNGQFLIAGTSNGDIAVVRLHPNGDIDDTFGEHGKAFFTVTPESREVGLKIVIQSDGRIIIGGTTDAYPVHDESHTNLLLIRLNANGSLDNSFGSSGVLIHDLGQKYDVFGDMQIDAAGRVLIGAGTSDDSYYATTDFLLLRFLANGVLDSSFGTNGIHRSNFGTYASISSINVELGGKILVAGLTNLNTNYDVALLRVNEGGTPDLTFGANGKVVYDAGYGVDEVLEDVLVAPDGKIVVTTAIENNGHNFLVARFLPNGTIDTTFNNGGVIVVDLGGIDWPSNIHMDQSGSFLVSGYTENGAEGGSGFIRLHTNGVLDTSFGVNGILKITTPRISGHTVLSSNHVLVFGSLYLPEREEHDFAVMKVLISQLTQPQPQPLPPTSETSSTAINVPSIRPSVPTTAPKATVAPNFQVKRTTIKTGKAINLSSVLSTASRGKKTWRVVSGRCSIRGSRLVAPAKAGTCRLRLSTAKHGTFGAMSTTVKISVAK
jgi:uncharacterized delta-60 repeat protein